MQIREVGQQKKTLPFTAVSVIDPRVDNGAGEKLRGPSLEGGRIDARSRLTLEKTLEEIWSQVLHLSSVDIYRNFFELGGDALRSLEVCCLAKKQGLHFSVQQFFQHPTIHGLTQFLSGEQRA